MAAILTVADCSQHLYQRADYGGVSFGFGVYLNRQLPYNTIRIMPPYGYGISMPSLASTLFASRKHKRELKMATELTNVW